LDLVSGAWPAGKSGASLTAAHKQALKGDRSPIATARRAARSRVVPSRCPPRAEQELADRHGAWTHAPIAYAQLLRLRAEPLAEFEPQLRWCFKSQSVGRV
jgi:hypothetical protein